MESFFLAETTKYLYLLFDPDNFIHNNGSRGTVVQTPNGECVIDAGGYFFTSEAHPIDAASVYCCSNQKKQDDAVLQKMHDDLNLLSLFNIEDEETRLRGKKLKSFTQDLHADKLVELNEATSEKLTSESGFQNSVIEILSNYLKTSDNADNSLLKLGASLELLKSQISKLESAKEQDTKSFMSNEKDVEDERKSTITEGKSDESMEGLRTGESDSNKGQQKTPVNQSNKKQVKPEPPTPSTKVTTEEGDIGTSIVDESKDIPEKFNEKTSISSDKEPHALDQQINSASNSSQEIKSDSENTHKTLEKVPKSVVLSVKTDSTGQASAQTGDKLQTDGKRVHHITDFKSVKPNNIFNLDSIYNILGGKQQKENVPNPNIFHLYQTINQYSLLYTPNPELMVCKAQPFHMRLSVRGEMFSFKDIK